MTPKGKGPLSVSDTSGPSAQGLTNSFKQGQNTSSPHDSSTVKIKANDRPSFKLSDDQQLDSIPTVDEVFGDRELPPPPASIAMEEADREVARQLVSTFFDDPPPTKKDDKHRATDNDAEKRSWGAPLPIPCGLKPVSSLPAGVLPESIRHWLEDTVDRLQVPLEFCAIPALVMAGSIIGGRIRIRPRRRDDWSVVPNLWGAVIGRPGVMKTPAIEQTLKPLRRLAAKAQEAHKEALTDWLFEKEAAEAKRQVARGAMKKEIKKSSQADLDRFKADLLSDEGAVPTERRYLVNDSTVEKYGELLNENPNGLLIFRDELTGWLRALDDERRANDRAFFLEAWNGDSPYTYDRIGRGTIHIANTTTSILGGIQPEPLRRYLRGALGQGQGDDGLMQRFQLAVYPDLPGSFRDVDRWPDTDSKNRAYKVFESLDGLTPETIGAQPGEKAGQDFIRFDFEAQEFFSSWYTDLRVSLRSGAYDHPALESHFMKYASLLPKIALILHLCELVDGIQPAGSVGLSATVKAAAWCEFLQSHALRIYAMGIEALANDARTLAKKLQQGEMSDPFKAREVYRKGWAGLTNPKEVSQALAYLVDLNWLQYVPIPADPESGSRPTGQYMINPKIKEVTL